MTGAVDSSGNNNNGTYVGSYSLEELPLTGSECGTCVKLTGGYIQADSLAAALTGSNIISGVVFVKIDTSEYSGEDWFARLININNATDTDLNLFLHYGKTFDSYILGYDSNLCLLSFDPANLTTTHMIYFEVNADTGEMKLSVNNTAENTESVSISATAFGTTACIGTYSVTPTEDDAANFYGWLDDVAFFNKALTEEELTSIKASCLVSTGLVWDTSTVSAESIVYFDSSDAGAGVETNEIYFALTQGSGTLPYTVDFNFGTSAFAHAVPAGYTSDPTLVMVAAGGSPTITNGGLTVTLPAGNTHSAKTNNALSMGSKIYFEFNPNSGNGCMIGYTNQNLPTSWFGGSSNGGYMWIGDTSIYGKLHKISSSGTTTDFTGGWCGMAIDIQKRKFWIRNKAGTWVATGDVEAQTGGFSWHSLTNSESIESRGVVSITSKSSGKWAVRFNCYGRAGCGIAKTNPDSWLSFLGSDADGYGVYIDDGGSIERLIHDGALTNLGDVTTQYDPTEVMFEVDFDTGNAWVGFNGTWYNSGNPVSGTNPTITGITAGEWHLAADLYVPYGTYVKILREEDFITPKSTGYTAWS